MKKSYIFYSALGALVAYELFTGSRVSDTAQMAEVIEVAVQTEPIKDFHGKNEAMSEVVSIAEDLLPIAIGVAVVPVVMKVIMYFLEP